MYQTIIVPGLQNYALYFAFIFPESKKIVKLLRSIMESVGKLLWNLQLFVVWVISIKSSWRGYNSQFLFEWGFKYS